MGLFFRVFQHLLPTGQAWRTTTEKTLRSFFEGLAGFVEHDDGPREFLDAVYEDAFPPTARNESESSALREWERQFGIEPNPTEAIRRLNLAAEWAAGGGQSPGYIQGVLQTAGFDVFVHEWWDPSEGDVPQMQCGDDAAECGEVEAECALTGLTRYLRDPRLYTDQPLIGEMQCSTETSSNCGEANAYCGDFLVNETGYIVNETLTHRAPPRIPDDVSTFPFFIYFAAETFPNLASIPLDRRSEFERLILKLRPLQNWVVILAEYFDAFLITEAEEPIMTESDSHVVI